MSAGGPIAAQGAPRVEELAEKPSRQTVLAWCERLAFLALELLTLLFLAAAKRFLLRQFAFELPFPRLLLSLRDLPSNSWGASVIAPDRSCA